MVGWEKSTKFRGYILSLQEEAPWNSLKYLKSDQGLKYQLYAVRVCGTQLSDIFIWDFLKEKTLPLKIIKWAFSTLPLDIPPSRYADRTIVWFWENLGRVQILCLWLRKLISRHFNWPHEKGRWHNLWFPIFWHWTFDRRRGLSAFLVLYSICRSCF